MNKAVLIAKKLQLWAAIRQLGEFYNEDKEFTAQYAKDVYESNDIEEALRCFTDLLETKVRIRNERPKTKSV